MPGPVLLLKKFRAAGDPTPFASNAPGGAENLPEARTFPTAPVPGPLRVASAQHLTKTITMKKFLTLAACATLVLGFARPVAVRAADDIVATAKSTGMFNTLVAALDAGGKTSMLQEKGPFTVFAPTDEAFKKLPKATLDDLLKPENKAKLASILAYHVIVGKAIMSKDITTMTSPPTANGATLAIQVGKGGVMVNKAKVVKADVPASNGVIHVIDTVLLPPAAKK